MPIMMLFFEYHNFALFLVFLTTVLPVLMSHPFSELSTAEDILKIYGSTVSGKNILITGASSGIGVETVRSMAMYGANIWIASRNRQKTEDVMQMISQDSSRLHFIELELSDLSSVNRCADVFLSLNIPLHILINNAGCMALNERTLTKDGFEMQFGTNHLGHFLLTKLLMPALILGAPSRVVLVSSKAHWRSDIIYEDINFDNTTTYEPWKAYGQSKTANMLHALGLSMRYPADVITAVSLHPGVIETELWRHVGQANPPNKSIPQGAATTVYCAVAPELHTGGHYMDSAEATEMAHYASDGDNADRLWVLSEALIAQSLSNHSEL